MRNEFDLFFFKIVFRIIQFSPYFLKEKFTLNTEKCKEYQLVVTQDFHSNLSVAIIMLSVCISGQFERITHVFGQDFEENLCIAVIIQHLN